MPPITKKKQQHHRPDVAQRADALAPAGALAGRQKIRPHQPDDVDGDDVHRHREQAGHDAGDEQFADVLLGDQAVDREHRGRRDHDAERAAGRDHAGGEALRIAVFAHLRIGDLGEGGGGGDRGAADRREAAAGGDGGDAEPAAEMAEEGVGGAEQLAAHAGGRGERAHQQKQRDDGEFGVGGGADRRLRQQLERRPIVAGQKAKAGDADQAHGDADRHTQQHQREQRDEAGRCHHVAAHPAALLAVLFDCRNMRLFDLVAPESRAQGANHHQNNCRGEPDPGDEVIDPHRLAQIEGREVVGSRVHHLDRHHPGEDDQADQRDDIGKRVDRAPDRGRHKAMQQVDGDVLATIAGAGDAPEDEDAEQQAADIVAVRYRPDEDVAEENRYESDEGDDGEKSRRRHFNAVDEAVDRTAVIDAANHHFAKALCLARSARSSFIAATGSTPAFLTPSAHFFSSGSAAFFHSAVCAGVSL